MNKTEFEKALNEIGYHTKPLFDYATAIHKYDVKFPVALVSNTYKNSMTTNEMSVIPDELFDVLIEYAKTPIDNRVEQKFYKVTLKDISGATQIIGYDVDEDAYKTFPIDTLFVSETRVIFSLTQEQVDNLPAMYNPRMGFTTAEEVAK